MWPHFHSFWPLADIYWFWMNKIIWFRHHQHGRWQARIGRVAGNKDLYLGTFSESSKSSLYSHQLLSTFLLSIPLHMSFFLKRKQLPKILYTYTQDAAAGNEVFVKTTQMAKNPLPLAKLHIFIFFVLFWSLWFDTN